MNSTHASRGRLYGRMTNDALMACLVVLIVPSNILGLALGIFYTVTLGKGSQRSLPLILSASLFFASFNSTKIPESDLYVYQLASEALSRASIRQLLLLYGHEPGYYLINWISVHQFGLGWHSWVFVFSFLFYFFWLRGLGNLCEFLNLDRTSRLAILLWAAFFPLVFFQSAHLVRQYIASSIGLFGIARFLTNGRGWLYFFVAPFFHVVAFVFLLVPVSAWLGQRSRRMATFLTVSGPLLMVLGGRALGQNLERLEALGLPSTIYYGVLRLSQSQFYELEVISSTALIFSLISLGISLFGVTISYPKSNYSSTQVSFRLAVFSAFNAVLASSIFVLTLFGFSEPATRLFQFVALQFPFALAVSFLFTRSFRLFVIATGMMMPFAFFLYPSPWNYDDPVEILLLPYYVFLFRG